MRQKKSLKRVGKKYHVGGFFLEVGIVNDSTKILNENASQFFLSKRLR